jgi:hypothetical protein
MRHGSFDRHDGIMVGQATGLDLRLEIGDTPKHQALSSNG